MSDAPRVSRKFSAWWIGVLIIVLVGAAVRFTGYNFGLPYIDTRDEATYMVGTLYLRGLNNQPFELPGYPPGILWVYGVAQVFVEQVTHQSAVARPADTVAVVRIAAILTGLLTIPIVGLLARRLGGDIAGLIAAGAWAINPDIVYQSSIAMPDAWLLLFTALALYWALLGLDDEGWFWPVLSVLSTLVGILFKYALFPLLGVGVAVTLWRWRMGKPGWRRALLIQIGAITLCASWLFLGYGATKLLSLTGSKAYATMFYQSGFSRALDLQLGVAFLSLAITQIGWSPWLYLVTIAGGVLAAVVFRQIKSPKQFGLLLVAGFAFVAAWFCTTYVIIAVQDAGYYVLPADVGFVVLMPVAIVFLVTRFGERFKRQWLRPTLTAGVALLWLAPVFWGTWTNLQVKLMPDTRATLQQWSARELGEGSILVDKNNQRTFNREWGGYTGPYRVWLETPLQSQPLSDWIAKYVYYAEIAPEDVQVIRQSEQGRSYLDQMLLLKQFPPEGQRFQWRGPSVMIFRLWKMQHPLDVTFGEQIKLSGFDLSEEQGHPGDVIHVKLYWQATQRPSDNYNIYVHFIPLDSRIPIAQADGTPISDDRPTLSWDDPTETLISRDLMIQLPMDLRPGQYQLVTGFYNYQTGQRLLAGANDFALLTTILITAP